MDSGIDPMAEREAQNAAVVAERSAPTMARLFARYDAEHLPRKSPRAAADDRSMWQKIVLPQLGTMKVAAVKPDDIDALHAEVSRTRPVRANRVVEVVRKAFNMAIRWGWRTTTQRRGFTVIRKKSAPAICPPPRVMKLSEALAAHPENASANAIKLLMLTGARRGEVLGARWDMFDLESRRVGEAFRPHQTTQGTPRASFGAGRATPVRNPCRRKSRSVGGGTRQPLCLPWPRRQANHRYQAHMVVGLPQGWDLRSKLRSGPGTARWSGRTRASR